MIQPVSSYTTWQLTEVRRRREVLEQLRLLEDQGVRRSEAARLLKTAESTLRDWLKLYHRANDWNDLMPKISTGRTSAVAHLEAQVGVEATAAVIAKVKAANLETGSNGGSWRFCTATMDGIPQAVVDVIHDPAKRSKHYIPRSLTKETKVTRVEKLAFQGRRALALNGGHVPRFLDVLPGDIFVPDDYTPTYGFWVPWIKSAEYPYGVKLLQGQMIGIVDYASLFRPGYALIAREHSSYRAADIWSFYGDLFTAIGLPRLGCQHEGGTWQANALRGVQIDYQEGEFDRERRVGALAMLPSTILPYHRQMAGGRELPPRLEVHRSILPKSKPIELAFSMFSKLEGTLWGALGSDQRAKPNERTKKVFEACRRGAADPRLHFLSFMEVRERLDKLVAYLNQDTMEGHVRQGRPVNLWTASVEENPLHKLPEAMRFLYSRHWKIRTIKGPFVDLSYTDENTREKVRLHYSNAEAFAHLDGEQVVVYHDRLQPEKTAQIVTPKGEYLCSAEFWSGTGAFLARNEEGFAIQAKYNSTVMSLTSIIAKHASSRQLPPEVAARRQRAVIQAREETRTSFSAPSTSPPVTPEPAPAPTLQDCRDTGAEGRHDADARPPARTPVRAMTWQERMEYDPDAESSNQSTPRHRGKEKTPLGANRAASNQTAN